MEIWIGLAICTIIYFAFEMFIRRIRGNDTKKDFFGNSVAGGSIPMVNGILQGFLIIVGTIWAVISIKETPIPYKSLLLVESFVIFSILLLRWARLYQEKTERSILEEIREVRAWNRLIKTDTTHNKSSKKDALKRASS